jgi:hypothetical protein
VSEETLTPTSATKLKKESTKLYQCKSGNVYRIRKMPLTSLANFLALDFKTSITEQLKDPVRAKRILETMDETLPVCIVEPRISEEPSENTIELMDVPSLDQIELFVNIVNFSGYTKEKMKEFEKFRDQSVGKSSKKSRKSNRKTTQ